MKGAQGGMTGLEGGRGGRVEKDGAKEKGAMKGSEV